MVNRALSFLKIRLGFNDSPASRIQLDILRTNRFIAIAIFFFGFIQMAGETASLGLLYKIIEVFAHPGQASERAGGDIIFFGIEKNSPHLSIILIMLLVAIQALESAAKYMSSICIGSISTFSRVYTVKKISHLVANASYRNYEHIRSGNVLAAITQGSEAIRFQLEELFGLAISVFLLLGYLLVLIKLSPWMMLVAASFASFLILLQSKLAPRIKRSTVKVADAFSGINTILIENFDGFVYFNSVGEHRWPIARVNLSLKNLSDLLNRKYRLTAISQPLSKFVTVLLLCLLLELGTKFWFSPSSGLATIGTFFIALQRLSGKLIDINQIFNSLSDNFGPISLLNDLIRLGDFRSLPNQDSVETKPLGAAFDLSANSLSYSYSRIDAAVVDDVSLSIRANEFVAIIGESGSGKSSLIKILTGLMAPDRGSVLVKGQDINATLKPTYQRSLSLVTHSPLVFSGTIVENITLQDSENINEGILWDSIKKAGLEHLILSQSEGIYTRIGPNGRGFSAGQCQKIMIARALYRRPSFLFLDEATSNLDPQSESEIIKSLQSLRGESTVVFVTHKIPITRYFDRIYVMRRGSIVEEGAFGDLLASGSHFLELLRSRKDFVGS